MYYFCVVCGLVPQRGGHLCVFWIASSDAIGLRLLSLHFIFQIFDFFVHWSWFLSYFGSASRWWFFMGFRSTIQILCFQFVKECLRFIFGFRVVTFMSDINVEGRLLMLERKFLTLSITCQPIFCLIANCGFQFEFETLRNKFFSYASIKAVFMQSESYRFIFKSI